MNAGLRKLASKMHLDIHHNEGRLCLKITHGAQLLSNCWATIMPCLGFIGLGCQSEPLAT